MHHTLQQLPREMGICQIAPHLQSHSGEIRRPKSCTSAPALCEACRRSLRLGLQQWGCWQPSSWFLLKGPLFPLGSRAQSRAALHRQVLGVIIQQFSEQCTVIPWTIKTVQQAEGEAVGKRHKMASCFTVCPWVWVMEISVCWGLWVLVFRWSPKLCRWLLGKNKVFTVVFPGRDRVQGGLSRPESCS